MKIASFRAFAQAREEIWFWPSAALAYYVTITDSALLLGGLSFPSLLAQLPTSYTKPSVSSLKKKKVFLRFEDVSHGKEREIHRSCLLTSFRVCST